MKQITKSSALYGNVKTLLFVYLLVAVPNIQLLASELTYQLGTMPVLNASVNIGYADSLPSRPFVLPRVLLHATLACTSNACTIRSKIAQHALLCSASFTFGALQTFSHEFGHAAADYAVGAKEIEIGMEVNWTNLLIGLCSGYVRCNPNFPNRMDKKNYEEWAASYDVYLRDRIISCFAGPVSGAISGYGAFKLIQAKYPAAFKNRWFRGICLANILWQDTLNLVPGIYSRTDGQKIYNYWQLKVENKKKLKKST